MQKKDRVIKWIEKNFERLARYHLLNWMPDKVYLKIKFFLRFKKKLNLNNPITFNEKMQWLKIYDRKPEYAIMVDKYEVKEYVKSIIGERYIIPTLGRWQRFCDINFDVLPEQFVLKCTHDSGGIVIVRNKDEFNKQLAKNKLEKSLRNNYYWLGREWPYKHTKPQIIAEKYMEDRNNTNLSVYKIFNFQGQPNIIQVIQNDKLPNETIDYYTTDWKKLDFRQNYPNSNMLLRKPVLLGEMLSLAKQLSRGFSFIRTDFYIINEEIYFSEFTFYSDAGFAKFEPEKWDFLLGEEIIL